MSLEQKSLELKKIISTYNTKWLLGDLSGLLKAISPGTAGDQLGKLSSPMRQLYFLAGLLLSTEELDNGDEQFSHEKWEKIVELLNSIEEEYDSLFFPKQGEEIDEEWKRIRLVAMPSFLSYFNQGPLNYEEQSINWVTDLYTQLDNIIEAETELKTEHFIVFYNSLDSLVQSNFQSFSSTGTLKPNWQQFSDLKVVPSKEMPVEMQEMFDERLGMMTFMSDHGIINRFFAADLVSDDLKIEQVNKILSLLSCSRSASDFLYYTSTRPGNPLIEKPIVNVGNDMFQVFEVKQVIHSIENLLEGICSNSTANTTKLIHKKGQLLENIIVDLFKKFFKEDYELYTEYYIDGCEQDILFIWKEKYAFIIEAKGYNLREPLRDPNRAFVRIKDDFKSCIGYGYSQTKRVEQKFIDQVPLRLMDKDGNLIKEIDTTKFENDFSIIVNLNSFGQIQIDLSTLLEIDESDVFPWAVKLDDLEVFLLTLIQKNESPQYFIDFLLLREELHGRLICSDELEICGAYLSKQLTAQKIKIPGMIATSPDLTKLFDVQYSKTMGFKNEKYLFEKTSGNYIFI